jgi:hypothetical protein
LGCNIVAEDPEFKELLDTLIENPSRDKNKATKVFEYLASQQPTNRTWKKRFWKINFKFWKSKKQKQIDYKYWEQLRKQNFIPIEDKFRPNVFNLTSPSSCFFKFNVEWYVIFFYIYTPGKNYP